MLGGLLPGRIVHWIARDGTHVPALVLRVHDRGIGLVELEPHWPWGMEHEMPGSLREANFGLIPGTWHEMKGCDGETVHRDI